MLNVQVDVIAIDFSEKLPFRLKQPVVRAAIKVYPLPALSLSLWSLGNVFYDVIISK